MNTQHRYQLEKYNTPSSRHTCPSCNQKRQWAYYIDTETGQQLPDHVGICNRKDSCGYHYTPKQFFNDNGFTEFNPSGLEKKPVKEPEVRPTSFIPSVLYDQSGHGYQEDRVNNFVQWLITLFEIDAVSNAVYSYCIGSSDKRPGAVIFWQFDIIGRIHTGKIVQYSPITGRRDKSTFPPVSWVHSVEKLPDYVLQQCLFGEHLLMYPENISKTVAIVESEKTAIVCSILLPDYVWLSRGSKTGAKWYLPEVHKCLIGRKVVLFPDLGAYDSWKEEAEKLNYQGCTVTVNRLLEDQATETDRNAGYDIADMLIRQLINQQLSQKLPVNNQNIYQLHYEAKGKN